MAVILGVERGADNILLSLPGCWEHLHCSKSAESSCLDISQQVSPATMKSNNKLSCGTEDVACSLREVIVHFCSESESHSSILCPVSSSWSWSQSISVWEAVLNTNSDKPFRCSVTALLSLRAPAVLILSFCKASKRDLSLEIFEGRFISGFPMFFWLFVLGQSFWFFCCFFFSLH